MDAPGEPEEMSRRDIRLALQPGESCRHGGNTLFILFLRGHCLAYLFADVDYTADRYTEQGAVAEHVHVSEHEDDGHKNGEHVSEHEDDGHEDGEHVSEHEDDGHEDGEHVSEHEDDEHEDDNSDTVSEHEGDDPDASDTVSEHEDDNSGTENSVEPAGKVLCIATSPPLTPPSPLTPPPPLTPFQPNSH